jgi:RNA polymerase sigma-70 factor (ECF subfamily)
MPGEAVRIRHDYAALDDAALAARIRVGDAEAFRHLTTRCNRRLFRVARGLVASDHEAEDIVQEAYVIAYGKLDAFRGESTLLTWLTRVVINEARQRMRNRKQTVGVEAIEAAQAGMGQVVPFPGRAQGDDPAAGAAREELRRFLEEAIGALPASFRVVFLLREVEECTVEETADSLGLRHETVRTRHHRARRMLRAALEARASASYAEAFQFLGVRCARMTERVMARIAAAI